MSNNQTFSEEPAHELSAEDLNGFVSGFIERRDTFLDICARHGSPLYIFDQDILTASARKFTSAFKKELPDIKVYYAMKCNNHPFIAQTFANNGLGLDVSSGLELQIALDAGADDIVFSGPGKTGAELTMAVEHYRRVTVLIDSFAELEKLQQIAESMSVTMRAGVRVMTKKHGIWRKFGIPLTDLSRFLDAAHRCGNVNVCGLQSHVSWNMDPSRQVEFVQTLGAMLHTLTDDQRAQIKFIDLGGGFWPEQGEWLQEAGVPENEREQIVTKQTNRTLRHFKRSAVSIEQFAKAIGEAVRKNILSQITCRICLEPGRWLCHDAMYILMTVLDKKEKDLLITDAGINTVGWDRFETDYFPVINLTKPDLAEHECLVMGSLCTPHDIWGYTYHGRDIESGDVLLIPNQGAYTFSLRQNFIKPLPKVVCIKSSENEIKSFEP